MTPFFVGHIHQDAGASQVEIEARNVFSARNPFVLLAMVIAVGLVGGSALIADGPVSASAATVVGAGVVGVLYVAVRRWQGAEIGRIFGLIERVANARTVEEARSIGRTF